ncbi:MAG TPA: glutamyl-tRNA reductase [Bacteroidia bacterium]|nr:glutamyl-tRNA reductase [Bacteroidia bacterium]
MDSLKVIAFTHNNLSLEQIGKLHLDAEHQALVLGALKINFGLEELLFLSTCNRVEVIMKSDSEINTDLVKEICTFINRNIGENDTLTLSENAEIFQGEKAVEHLLRVASSLDSLVVGEREIITQVRKAYDYCNSLGLTGDLIRILVKHTIETAKDVYTHTDIAKNPVSIVSLAYRQLKELGIKNNARLLFVGSGVTNTAFANYLQKHQFANFSVFNRTLANAEKLASSLNGNAFSLEALNSYQGGFDVMVVCTASSSPVVNKAIYDQLTSGENSKKIIIDLGIPANVDATVIENNKRIHYINIQSLKEIAATNLQLRKNEISKCEKIIAEKTEQFNQLLNERRIELAFGEIPKKVKAIKEIALSEVFAKEIDQMDENGRQVLDKVLSYVEKKYNAVAIKTAKEVLRSPHN